MFFRQWKPLGVPVLSVIHFQLAFDDISKIITRQNHVNHCIYTDDLYVFCKKNDLVDSDEILEKVLKDIISWTEMSGAKLSLEKCKKYHVYGKHNCNSFNSKKKINNFKLQNIKKLKILGLMFTSSYNFKECCLELKKIFIR